MPNIDTMLKYSRKQLKQRKMKPVEKHSSETFKIVEDSEMSDRKVMQEAIEELQYALSKITAESEALRKATERYRWLANYLVGPETNHDDAIVSSNTKAEIDAVIDAARGVK